MELMAVRWCKCIQQCDCGHFAFRMTEFSVILHSYYLCNNHIRSYMTRKGGGFISLSMNLCFLAQKEKMPLFPFFCSHSNTPALHGYAIKTKANRNAALKRTTTAKFCSVLGTELALCVSGVFLQNKEKNSTHCSSLCL